MNEIMHSYSDDYVEHPEIEGGKVVKYFNEFYTTQFKEDIEVSVKAVVEKYPEYRIVFTGHSLGGAMTVLAAVDTALSNWVPDTSKIIVYTFGQPRVGNYDFTKVLDEG